MLAPSALPGGGDFPVEFVIATTDETEDALVYAEKLQVAAMRVDSLPSLQRLT